MIVASPFPRRPIPVSGESVYGFERRLAVCAHYESLGVFRRATGLLDLTPISAASKFARLAQLAGLDANGLNDMSWRLPDGTRRYSVVSLLGHTLRSCHVRPEFLRFCPECLSEDGPREQRIHRQAWQILHVSACPRHRTLLVEACDKCGEPLAHWRKTKPWACACGREMTEMVAISAPVGAVSISSAVMRALSTDPSSTAELIDIGGLLPSPFDAFTVDALLSALSKIGVLATTPLEKDEPVGRADRFYMGAPMDRTVKCGEAAHLMDEAYGIVSSWPRGMDKVFASLAGRNREPEQDHPVHSLFATRMGYRLLAPIRSADGDTIRVIDDALKEWLFRERGIYTDGRRRSKVSDEGDVAIDRADALRRLEGRVADRVNFSTWSKAGAVAMIGSKVSLQSVEETVKALSHLRSSDFKDSMSVQDLSSRFLYNEHYRRHDAIRDILSGKIRVQRIDEHVRGGLASLHICRSDLLECKRLALDQAKVKKNSAPQRAGTARRQDRFYRQGRIVTLLSELWPAREVPDLTQHPSVRRETRVYSYNGRDMFQRFYSVRDALCLMEMLHGDRDESDSCTGYREHLLE